MIHTATETRRIPIAAPKEITCRPAFVFIRDLCHHLNRYMDAVQKVHVPEENYRQRYDEHSY
jgi:hypothetical protein